MPDIPPLQPEDPARLGPYTLLGRLGRGGFGVVYLAENADGERVAIKLLQTALATAGGERERFAREAAAAKQVARFCTAQVLDADIAGDQPYIVSEYVPGPSLQAFVTERGPVEGGALDRLAIGTATALVAIHQAGVIHRDLKPPNVLMGPDGPRVIDFGIARMMDRAATVTGHTLGTPAYMAPEQVLGREITPAADVFAWGATLVFAANVMPPFGRDSVVVLAHRIVNEPPELGVLSGNLRTLVAECLDKDPARRPTASALLMRLLGHSTAPAGGHAPTAIMAEGVTAAAIVTPTPTHRVGQEPTRHDRAAVAAAAGLPETHAVGAFGAVSSSSTVPPTTTMKRRRRWPLVVAGVAGALILAGGTAAAMDAFDHHGSKPRPNTTTTVTTTPPPTAGGAQPPPDSGAASTPPQHHQPPPVILYVQASGCTLGDTRVTCTITLRATGGPVHWTATVGDPLSMSSSSGDLNPGQTYTITITLHPSTPRVPGSAIVTITAGGTSHTVQVTWLGEPTPDASAS